MTQSRLTGLPMKSSAGAEQCFPVGWGGTLSFIRSINKLNQDMSLYKRKRWKPVNRVVKLPKYD